MKKHYCILLFIFSCLSVVKAQTNYNKLPVYIPPAPDAAALSKYGNLDVGLQTGSLNFKVPLLTLEGNQWAMPIDIQYFTSGVKVDQIASRVGMGWALSAGGVVTRSVNHNPDELSTRSTLPSDWNSFGQNFLTYLENVAVSNSMDTEPDEFSYNFNGYSGKFILDANKNPISIPHSNLKISFIFNSTTSSSVVIKTPDGSVYYFEDTEYTSATSVSGGANQPIGTSVPTSWYLTKVVLPNKETVNFTYQNIDYDYVSGISQTLTRSFDAENQNPCPSLECGVVDNENTSLSLLYINGKILSKINFRSMEVNFDYITRLDLPSANNGDKLLEKITLKNNNQVLKSFQFDYQYGISSSTYESWNGNETSLKYRPYLTFLKQKGKNGEEEGKHTFTYEDINAMPPRLSFSQDVLGHFNGKLNSSLIPKPVSTVDQQMFWRATANRDPDWGSSVKGALIKIEYPTGGTDRISYSLNDYFTTKTVQQRESLNLSVPRTNTVYPIVKTSPNFTTTNPQTVTLAAHMWIEMGSDGSSSYDPDQDLMIVEVLRSSDGQLIFSKTLKAGQDVSEDLTGIALSTSYFYRITCLVPNLRCTSVISYDGVPLEVTTNVQVPGLRVSSLISKSSAAEPELVKSFYYAKLSDLSKSSGNVGYAPLLFQDATSYNSGPCGPSPSGLAYFPCRNMVAYSNSLVNQYPYSQNYMYYSNVIEALGSNLENGGTSHEYIVERDSRSMPVIGNNVTLGVKLSNNGFSNGLEKEQIIFKKKDSTFVNLKRTVNHYHESVRSITDAYVINKTYDYPTHSNPPAYREFEGFNIHRYHFYSAWVYKDTSTVYDYNENGGYVKSKTVYEYGNPLHTQQTRVSTTGSDQKTIEIKYKYPHEKVSLGEDPGGVYQAMVNDHLIQPVVEEQRLKDAVQTDFTRINYTQPFTHLFYPDSVQVQSVAGSPVESRIRYHKYDDAGNALSVSQEKGSKICYVWGYGRSKPIAEIKNADYATVEAVLGGSGAINTFCASYTKTDTEVRNFLAVLRTDSRLKDAQVASFTYDLFMGTTSATDAKGMTTYYEYDSFQRLKYIKDQDGNIVKSYDYHYKP